MLIGYLTCLSSAFSVAHAEENQSHAMAMHDKPLYQKDFKHFSYNNPKAEKGGLLKLGGLGTFDSLNPFIAKGNAAEGLSLIYDTLTVASADEPFSRYALVAKSIRWPNDRSWVEFSIDPRAKFHDGKPITSEDIEFSYETLISQGSPIYKTIYNGVRSIERKDNDTIRFNFINGDNKELALVIGGLPILPKHYWEDKDFSQTNMDVALSSGPYTIEKAVAGKTLIYKRQPDYWAKDHPVNKGHYNFDVIQYDYYRDGTVLLEALKAGQIDFRLENSSKQWATAYDSPAISEGKLIKIDIAHQSPAGMQAFVLNLRNPLFADIRVRQALNLAFDFEWLNSQLFYDAYTRSRSFFNNSEFAATGLPSKEELALLTPLRSQLPDTLFTKPSVQPKTQGDGRNRKQLRQAKSLLKQAGWTVKNNQLVDANGTVFQIEFLLFQQGFERIINPYIKSLSLLGIQANIRKVEMSQYINRLRNYEFDVVTSSMPQSLSPGAEQIQYWHSSTADIPAGRNLAGIKNPAVDSLVESVVTAKNRAELVTATRALDRALLHNWYVIPQWYINSHRVAYWDKFKQPQHGPKYDNAFMTHLLSWWIK